MDVLVICRHYILYRVPVTKMYSNAEHIVKY